MHAGWERSNRECDTHNVSTLQAEYLRVIKRQTNERWQKAINPLSLSNERPLLTIISYWGGGEGVYANCKCKRTKHLV